MFFGRAKEDCLDMYQIDEFDEGAQIREVYAHFGLTLYLAQVLEHGIVNALVYAELIPARTGKVSSHEQWAKEFDTFMGLHFEKTLGRLIDYLDSKVAVPGTLADILRRALTKRNWLAHSYFRDRAADFMSPEGRWKMIEELQAAQKLFQDADKLLEQTIRPFRERFGFTDERLEKMFEEYMDEIIQRRSADTA